MASPNVSQEAPQETDNSSQSEQSLPCSFPLEMRGGRCPVAVFNSPNSPNERISVAAGLGGAELRFTRGLLAVFTEDDASVVRGSNPGGSTYIEANARLSDDPLVCKICYPQTRWYSQDAYTRHTTFAHVD